MTTFNGRRAPNLTQYLREDLNVIPGSHPSPEESFTAEEDLAMFTNTQFFDFDSGQNTDFQPQDPKPEPTEGTATTTEALGDFASLEFMTGDFAFPDFSATYTSPTISSFPENLGSLQPIQPNPQSQYPATRHYQAGNFAGHAPPVSDSQKAEANGTSRPLHPEDMNRVAAEEDKRRRNTAASARFRIKKKQREQALEKSAKEMTEKVTALENRIQQLETENKWLKNLIMEKNGGEDASALWKDRKASDDKKDESVKSVSSKSSSSRSSATSEKSRTSS